MTLDPEFCYAAHRQRDAAWDGRFFTAVRTTKIFCRPICPAPAPKRENCLFFASAAAAIEAGFRPCLRCRPETAPGSGAWNGTASAVARALRLIEEGALAAGSVSDLAERVGLGERQLRRLFGQHVGASPRDVEQTRRLLAAKRLLDETQLSPAEVAFAAGYRSVRRFHAAFHEVYGRPPESVRRRRNVAANR